MGARCFVGKSSRGYISFYLFLTAGGLLFCAVHLEIRIWCLTATMVFFWFWISILFLCTIFFLLFLGVFISYDIYSFPFVPILHLWLHNSRAMV